MKRYLANESDSAQRGSSALFAEAGFPLGDAERLQHPNSSG
jgi:hypothetical protein